jgi:hypothetical protein
MRPTRFTTGASVVATVSLPLAGVSPLFLGGSRAFVGSALAVGLVGTVFAAYNTFSVRRYGQPRLAAALLATVFGVWTTVSPLVYGATGVVLVAAVQSFGMLAAAFAGYTTVEALELVARGRPLALEAASADRAGDEAGSEPRGPGDD